MAVVELIYDVKAPAWVTGNTYVPKLGEPVYLTNGTYAIGDNVTQVQNLTFYGGSGGGSQTLQQVLTTGSVLTQNNTISGAYDLDFDVTNYTAKSSVRSRLIADDGVNQHYFDADITSGHAHIHSTTEIHGMAPKYLLETLSTNHSFNMEDGVGARISVNGGNSDLYFNELTNEIYAYSNNKFTFDAPNMDVTGNVNVTAGQFVFLDGNSQNMGIGRNVLASSLGLDIINGYNAIKILDSGEFGIYTLNINASTVPYLDASKNLISSSIQADGNNHLFTSNYGIDSIFTGGSDVLNIGATNADVINIGRAGATVNILGAALYEYAANQYVLDKLITLNYNGALASGAGVGFEIEENSVITGYLKTNASRNAFDFLVPAIASKATLSLSNLTADRQFDLPDAAGTIALQSYVTGLGYITASSTNTLTNKTLTSSTNVIGGATMTLGSDASFDTYYRNSSGVLTRLGNGTTGQVLQSTTGSAPAWTTPFALCPIYSGKQRFIPYNTITTSTGVAGSVWYTPYYVGRNHTVTTITLEVTTAVAASNVRLALYADNNGVPGALIESSLDISAATTGDKPYPFSTPRNLNAQVYWMAAQVSSASIGVRFSTSLPTMIYLGGSGTANTYKENQAYGAFPVNATPVVVSNSAMAITLTPQ
jgi:hypothetical protein